MLRIDILRKSTEDTAQHEGFCAICATSFEFGTVFVWVSTATGVDELCERCLRGLCEFAR